VQLDSISALVTGGSSGLGLATVRRLRAAGAKVGIADLNPPSDEDLASLGAGVVYAKTDITDEAAVNEALDVIEAANGPLRAVVHCAGRGGDRVRILDKEGNPGSLETFAEVVRVNLVGTYNILRLGAARIARTEPVDGERGDARPHDDGEREEALADDLAERLEGADALADALEPPIRAHRVEVQLSVPVLAHPVILSSNRLLRAPALISRDFPAQWMQTDLTPQPSQRAASRRDGQRCSMPM